MSGTEGVREYLPFLSLLVSLVCVDLLVSGFGGLLLPLLNFEILVRWLGRFGFGESGFTSAFVWLWIGESGVRIRKGGLGLSSVRKRWLFGFSSYVL